MRAEIWYNRKRENAAAPVRPPRGLFEKGRDTGERLGNWDGKS